MNIGRVLAKQDKMTEKELVVKEPKVKTEIGMKFNRWTLVKKVAKGYEAYWECICDCGNQKTVRQADLKSGKTQSCGCLQKEIARSSNIKHGQADSPEYGIWLGVKQRCLNPNFRFFKDYGGRGIKVCDRWFDFANFLQDMGKRPTPKHTIERVNNDGDYEPNNCCWATRKEQSNNQRKTILLTYQGKTKSLSQWCEELNLNPGTIKARIRRFKWSTEKAFEMPATRSRTQRKRFEVEKHNEIIENRI